GRHEMFDKDGLMSPEVFSKLHSCAWIVDGRDGGLVRGRLHSTGNIVMICPSNKPGYYEFTGLMEGDEYILNNHATVTYWDRLQEINSNPPDEIKEIRFRITRDTRIITTHAD